jgi:uncharacterized protein
VPADTAAAILVDANLLMWAHHRTFVQHELARDWWATTLSETPLVGLAWPSILAFLRLSTHPRVLEHPPDIDSAWQVAREWLARPNVRTPVPTDRHRGILGEVLVRGHAAGDHTSDAHLAALAIEWGLELQSADRDFARYPTLRWRDPIAPTPPA